MTSILIVVLEKISIFQYTTTNFNELIYHKNWSDKKYCVEKMAAQNNTIKTNSVKAKTDNT